MNDSYKMEPKRSLYQSEEVALFLPFPMISHINAFCGLARNFSKDFAVFFATSPEYADYVTQQGFAFIPLTGFPFGLGFEDSLAFYEHKRTAYIATIINRATDRIFRDRSTKLSVVLQSIIPSIVFIDAIGATDYLILMQIKLQYDFKVISVQTMMNTFKNSRSGPLNVLKPLDISQREIRICWDLFKLKKWMLRMMNSAKYLGFTDDQIIRRALRKLNVPTQDYPSKLNPFQVAFDSIPELILSSAIFDIRSSDKLSHQSYVGFQVDRERSETSSPSLAELLLSWKQLNDRKIVYVAFGSVSTRQRLKPVLKLLGSVKWIASQRKKWLFVVSAKNLPSSSDLTNLVYIDFAPQLRILKCADLFISSGGFNSVKESLILGVPLLIYPIVKDWDANGNAMTVVAHGVGEVGDPFEPEDEMMLKIDEILSNFKYKKNTIKFCNNGLSADQLVNLVEQLS